MCRFVINNDDMSSYQVYFLREGGGQDMGYVFKAVPVKKRFQNIWVKGGGQDMGHVFKAVPVKKRLSCEKLYEPLGYKMLIDLYLLKLL